MIGAVRMDPCNAQSIREHRCAGTLICSCSEARVWGRTANTRDAVRALTGLTVTALAFRTGSRYAITGRTRWTRPARALTDPRHTPARGYTSKLPYGTSVSSLGIAPATERRLINAERGVIGHEADFTFDWN